jgi:hypothetical protein
LGFQYLVLAGFIFNALIHQKYYDPVLRFSKSSATMQEMREVKENSMQIHIRHTENHERWVWTEGLGTQGQQDVAVMVPWPEHDPRDLLLTHLLDFLEQYLNSQPKRILPGQTLRYGWMLLYFVSDDQNRSGAGPDVLLIEELEHPFSPEVPSYVPGVTHTLALLQLQHEAMQRNHITGEAIYPHCSEKAIVCSRVTPETIQSLRPLKADRAWQPDNRTSGWFIGCCDQGHNHNNADELSVIHLFHLVKRLPALFPYLAMPVGTMLLFEESRAVIFRPGEQAGQVDPDSLLSSLP